MKEKFKAIIVEDNLQNIEILKLLITKYNPSIEVIGEAKNSKEFIDLYLSLRPDIIFLDIELGEEKNSLEILEELDTIIDCEIIVTSSYEKYAIKAINKFNISGYVVKPIDFTNLTKVVSNTIENIEQKRTRRISNTNEEDTLPNITLAIPLRSSIELILISDIVYLEADGKYTVFYMLNGETKIVSRNIGEYEKTLPKNAFLRIHYKHIVNINRIVKINKSAGNYCEMVNGTSLTVAKRRQESLRRFLNL